MAQTLDLGDAVGLCWGNVAVRREDAAAANLECFEWKLWMRSLSMLSIGFGMKLYT